MPGMGSPVIPAGAKRRAGTHVSRHYAVTERGDTWVPDRRCAPSGMTASKLRGRREGVASLHGAGFQAGLKPALALLRRAVRKRVRNGVALRLLLQPIVADRRRGFHRGFDIARLDQVPLLVGFRRPDAGKAV